jgi:hypothetical protein
MNNLFLKFLAILTLACPALAHEGPWTASRPDGHAPISVMGDHMHKMGEWMVSYRYMTMDMKGLKKGSSDITKAQAAALYPMSMMGNMLPKEMTMDMHMLGTMHAISDKWTFMGMVNYLDNEMSMQSGMKMESSGLSDFKVGGLYELLSTDHGRRAHLNLSLSLPTGSIDEKSGSNLLGYGMQLGSGTWDFNPAITFLGQTEDYSWGAQLGGVLRMNDNKQDYNLGNRLEGSLWGARKITDSISASVKFDYLSQSDLDGEDSRMMMMKTMSSAFDPKSQGRDVSTLGLGLNYYFQDGGLQGHRFAAEWETPISQNVNGVQLELDSVWTLGWQYAW